MKRIAPDLRDTRSHANLKEAFAKDAGAAALCAYFSEIARIEGLTTLAKSLHEIAEQHIVEAGGSVDFLMRAGDPFGDAAVGDTHQNVRALVANWTVEGEERLPEMARTARAEGFVDLASWFETLANARKERALRLGLSLRKEDA